MLDLNDAKPLGGELLRYDLDLVVAGLRYPFCVRLIK